MQAQRTSALGCLIYFWFERRS